MILFGVKGIIAIQWVVSVVVILNVMREVLWYKTSTEIPEVSLKRLLNSTPLDLNYVFEMKMK